MTSLALASWACGMLFIGMMLYASMMDVRHGILPDTITLTGSALGLLVSAMDLSILNLAPVSLEHSVLGALVGGLFFTGLAYAFPKSLGRGDGKYLFMLGAWLGIHSLPLLLTVACASGLGYAKLTKAKLIPFGVFLSLGAVAVLVGKFLEAAWLL